MSNKKTLFKEQHKNAVILESYKEENIVTQNGSPVIASFKINITTENLENQNGRIYPTEVWNQYNSFQKGGKYLDESGKLRPLSLLGNLDHPKDGHSEVFLTEAGLTWFDLVKDGDDWNGTAHVLDTPQGKIIKTFLDYAKHFGGGEQIGVSTRALGESVLVESTQGTMVEEILPDGFEIISIDFVYNPSSVKANTPLMEQKQRKQTLVESINKLKQEDMLHKDIYDTVIKDILEVKPLNENNETKVVFAHAVVEFLEGGESTDTEAQAELRQARKTNKKFTDLDYLGDLMYFADLQFDNTKGGYDKLYIDYYGKVGDEVKNLIHLRYDLGDKADRNFYPHNSDIPEIEQAMQHSINASKLMESHNKYVKQVRHTDLNKILENTAISVAKQNYVKELKDTEYKLHNAIYVIDNMSDTEYKQTKYYIQHENKAEFLQKLVGEHNAVLQEIEALVENKGETMKQNKTNLNENKTAKALPNDLLDIVESYNLIDTLEAGNFDEWVFYLNNLSLREAHTLVDEILELGKYEVLRFGTVLMVDYIDGVKVESMQESAKALFEATGDKDLTDEEPENNDEPENGDESETDEEPETELTLEEKVDNLSILVNEILDKLELWFEPVVTTETDEETPDEDSNLEDLDFSDEDIDNMTEEELLGLEELLELE